MKKKNKSTLFKHQLLITAISVFAVVITTIGGSYAIFSSSSKADEYNVLKVGNLEISYVDTGDGYGDVLSLNGAFPISDAEGSATSPYRFNISNTGSIAADFKIKILTDESIVKEDGCENNLLDPKFIKYKFNNQEPVLLSTKEAEDYVIYNTDELLPGSSEIHEIRIWIDENATNEILGKHFHGKVVVESIQSGVDDSLSKEYKMGQAVTLKDGSKWHVLENSDSLSSTVTLLSDYNVNNDGSYNQECSKDINSISICSPNVFDIENNRPTANNSYCQTPLNGCNIYGTISNTVTKTSNIKDFIDNIYLVKLKESLTSSGGSIDNLSATIPTMQQLANVDGKEFSQTQITFTLPWLTSTSYWTSTASTLDTSYVWAVVGEYNNSFIQYANNTTQSGVRPAITVSKINIS